MKAVQLTEWVTRLIAYTATFTLDDNSYWATQWWVNVNGKTSFTTQNLGTVVSGQGTTVVSGLIVTTNNAVENPETTLSVTASLLEENETPIIPIF